MLFRAIYSYSYSCCPRSLIGVVAGILKSLVSEIDLKLYGYIYLFLVSELAFESEFFKLL
jgi:hypothetical protein